MVVPLVSRAFAGPDFRLAARNAATRNRIFRCAAALLDGGDLRPAPLSWATPGLLFDEHVERACALGSRCLESNAGQIARRRCNRRRLYWDPERDSCAVHFKRSAACQR